MKILKPDRFPGELVQVRRLDDRVAGKPQVAIALIVCNHKDDIGRLFRCEWGTDRQQEQTQHGNE